MVNIAVKSAQPSKASGLLLTGFLALMAMAIGKWLPLLGGPVCGIVIGLVLRNTLGVKAHYLPGLQFTSTKVLQWSIIGLGFGLSLQQVAHTGLDSLWVTGISIMAAFLSAWILGHWLGITPKLKMLIGMGTAICGGSAIAAISPVIKPKDHEVAFAITTIFIFNIVAVLIFPAMGHWLGMSDQGFGMWAGTAINDTSSVVAAGYSYSQAAGDYATIVKLTRASLIIPICLGLIAIEAWKHKRYNESNNGFHLARIFPWFILWFVVASGINSLGLIPDFLQLPLRFMADFLIVMALTAIGLCSELRGMASAGIRPILLGLGVWISVAGSSLLVQSTIGAW